MALHVLMWHTSMMQNSALGSVMHAIILVHTCRYLYLLLGKYAIENIYIWD